MTFQILKSRSKYLNNYNIESNVISRFVSWSLLALKLIIMIFEICNVRINQKL